MLMNSTLFVCHMHFSTLRKRSLSFRILRTSSITRLCSSSVLVDEEVVHVNDKDRAVDEIMEQMIHHGLEDGGAVGHAIEHDSRFEGTAMSSKGGFPAILFKNLEVVITIMEVQFGEKLGTLEMVYEVGDEGERVGVVDCLCIDIAIVLDHAFGPILFGDEEDR